MQIERRYEHLFPDDVENIRAEAPICYLPLGAMEWHDQHAPMGSDSFIAHGLCLGLADETGGVVLPAHHWSIHGADDREGPYVWDQAHGTLCIHDPDVWEAAIRAQINAVAAKGWKVIVLMAGHVGQPERNILETLARQMSEPGQPQVLFIYPYQYTAGDHAGRFETNVLLGLQPAVVRDAASRGNPFCSQPKDLATADEGRQAAAAIIRGAAREVRAALLRSGAAPRDGLPLVNALSAPIRWTAKWIAPPGEPHPNSYFLARRRFELAAAPRQALLHIAADARYAAYVNGQFVGSGPARGTHRRYFADSFDIAALLRPGANWIAAEVHCCLAPSYVMVPQRPALLAEVEGLAASSAAWQVRRDPARRTDAAVYTMQIGFSEWRDMAAEPAGWMTGQDGDAQWSSAEEIGTPDRCGERVTVPRPIGDLARNVILPRRVVETGCVPDAGAALARNDYARLMTEERHLPPRRPNVQNPAALTRTEGVTVISPPGDRLGTYLLLDFEGDVFGQLVFDVDAPAGTIMDVGHDEALEFGRLIALHGDYRFADRFVLREGRQEVAQRLHSRGLRYLLIVFRNAAGPIRLHAVRVASRTYGAPVAATFRGCDPFLTELWQACGNTVRLCSSDTFMDCPWREQAFWICDQAMTSLYYLALTGDGAFAAHNLRVGADGARPDGLIPPVYPSHGETFYPAESALWTFALHDYHLYTGDRAALAELLPVMEKALAVYDAWRGTDGLVGEQEGMTNFIDWGYRAAPAPLRGKTAILNMLIAAAYKRAAALETAAGRAERAQAYGGRSAATVAAVNAAFWDAARGCFRDCAEPPGAAMSSQHPLAVGLYFDLLAEPQKSLALRNLLNPDLVGCELYYQHFVLGALAASGRMADALAVVRRLWGRMILEHSDTVWESFTGRFAFNRIGSLCHAFACAPLYLIQAGVLGVRPLTPGFSTFAVAPQLADLGDVSGAIPTPRGRIWIKAEDKADGQTQVTLDVPAGTQARTPDGRVFGPGCHRLELPRQA